MTPRRPAPLVRPMQPVMDRPDGLEALWHAIVKCAIDDYEDEPHTCRNYRTAAAWLRGTRLLLPDGSVDRMGYPKLPPRIRRRKI